MPSPIKYQEHDRVICTNPEVGIPKRQAGTLVFLHEDQRHCIVEFLFSGKSKTFSLSTDDIAPELYHISRYQPDYHVWGIYSKAKKSTVTRPFLLTTVCFDYDKAIDQAYELQKVNPTRDYSIQGAPNSGALPEKYTI